MDPIHAASIKTFIREHLKEEFTLTQLAEHVGYSAFHLAREFKAAAGLSVMDYTREQRILAAAAEIGAGGGVCEAAMDFCFDTHAGFTKAFSAVIGCTPADYRTHAQKMKTKKGVIIMEDSKIVIRHICKDDVQDLWENVYSAMTPRQITEDKILPMIEAYKRGEGLALVAAVDGRVVMSLPMTKAAWIPLGFVWDNNFVLTGGEGDDIMRLMLNELKRQAKQMGIGMLLSPQQRDSDSSKAMQSLGFAKAGEAVDWEYLMMPL